MENPTGWGPWWWIVHTVSFTQNSFQIDSINSCSISKELQFWLKIVRIVNSLTLNPIKGKLGFILKVMKKITRWRRKSEIQISKLLHFLSFLWWQVFLREWEKIFHTYFGPKTLTSNYLCYIDVPPIHVAKRPGIGNWIHTQCTSGTCTIISVWMCLPSYFLTRPMYINNRY